MGNTLKPKILFAIHYLELGGAEMALIGLLNTLDYTRVDVDLFVYSHKGELMKLIPSKVHLLPCISSYQYIEENIQKTVKAGKIGVVAGRALSKMRYRLYNLLKKRQTKKDESYFQFLEKYLTPFLPKISNEHYDLAINFCGMQSVILDKVKAKKKLTWLHTDYSTVTLNEKISEKLWKRFDKIVSISPAVTKAFLQSYPNLSSKIVEIENILSPQLIRQRSIEFDASREMSGNPILLSIGRFSYPKNFDSIPEITSMLIDKGLKELRWYIIGYGEEEALIRRKIDEFGVSEYVKILGKKTNPYPYIKKCDYYIQPSRYEGKSITVQEAQILLKPVIITKYSTSTSQVNNGVDGIILPKDNKVFAQSLFDFLNKANEAEKLIKNLSYQKYDRIDEISKFYSLV